MSSRGIATHRCVNRVCNQLRNHSLMLKLYKKNYTFFYFEITSHFLTKMNCLKYFPFFLSLFSSSCVLGQNFYNPSSTQASIIGPDISKVLGNNNITVGKDCQDKIQPGMAQCITIFQTRIANALQQQISEAGHNGDLDKMKSIANKIQCCSIWELLKCARNYVKVI